jgi:hypothetical protein
MRYSCRLILTFCLLSFVTIQSLRSSIRFHTPSTVTIMPYYPLHAAVLWYVPAHSTDKLMLARVVQQSEHFLLGNLR